MIAKLVRGFIDGALSTLGIVVGASAASLPIIIAAAVGGTLANGISNILSAFSAEGVKQYQEIRSIEKAMVSRELKGSELDRRTERSSIVSGSVDGLGTIVGGAIPILPYLFLSISQAIYVSVALVIATVFVIGIYLGKLSRRNMLLSALKMAVFAVVVAVAVYLIQSAIVGRP